MSSTHETTINLFHDNLPSTLEKIALLKRAFLLEGFNIRTTTKERHPPRADTRPSTDHEGTQARILLEAEQAEQALNNLNKINAHLFIKPCDHPSLHLVSIFHEDTSIVKRYVCQATGCSYETLIIEELLQVAPSIESRRYPDDDEPFREEVDR